MKRVEKLTFYLVGSLVNPSQQQEKDKARRMKDIYGPKCSESFAKLSPDGFWQKTSGGCFQLTITGHSERYSKTWPKAGIVLDGYAMELVMSARRTEGKGSLSWPTARAVDGIVRHSQKWMKKRIKENRDVDLTTAVKMWPTPRAGNPGSRKPGTGGEVLAEEAKRWSTPQSRDYRTGEAHRWDNPEKSRNLNDQVAKEYWPTPKNRDYRSPRGGAGEQKDNPDLNVTAYMQENKPQKGQLNAAWVECLMGFPQGWTELNGPLAPANNTTGNRRGLQQA